MKVKDIVELITAHYKGDSRAFFYKTIQILKEFKEEGYDEVVQSLDFMLKCNVKIAPKREITKLEDLHEEVSFEDAEKLGWIMEPQAKPQAVKCPKCGSTNIESNKDINNPFIRCKDCGHYLREGKK